MEDPPREGRYTVVDDDEVRVLHVDDEPDVVELTATVLEREYDGFTVDTTTDPRDVVDRVADHRVDCIVSDHQMPHMDGLDLLQAVREDRPDLPFILFTGQGSEEIASEAITSGVTEYLQKGTGVDQYTVLGNRIRQVVERYRAEKARRELRRQYRDLIENAPYAVFVYRDGEIVYTNEEWAELLNAESPSQVEGLSKDEFVHPEEQPTVDDRIERVTRQGTRVPWREKKIVGMDGGTRIVESSGAPVTYEGETGLQVVARDVTDRVRRERELREAKERFETVFEYSHDPIMIIDPDGDRIYDANQRACELLGYSHEALTALSPGDIHPHEIDRFREFIATVTEDGEGYRDDLSCYTAEGRTVPVEASASLITIDGHPYMLAVLRTRGG